MGIEGRVFVEFVINKDGSLSDVRAIKVSVLVVMKKRFVSYSHHPPGAQANNVVSL